VEPSRLRDAKFRRAFYEDFDAVNRYCLRRLSPDDANDAAAQMFVVAWREVDQMPTPARWRAASTSSSASGTPRKRPGGGARCRPSTPTSGRPTLQRTAASSTDYPPMEKLSEPEQALSSIAKPNTSSSPAGAVTLDPVGATRFVTVLLPSHPITPPAPFRPGSSVAASTCTVFGLVTNPSSSPN
jgi:hypothetical protein